MEPIVVETGPTFVTVADGPLSVQVALGVVGAAEVEPATVGVREARFPTVGQTASQLQRVTASDTDVPCHVRFGCKLAKSHINCNLSTSQRIPESQIIHEQRENAAFSALTLASRRKEGLPAIYLGYFQARREPGLTYG